MKNLPRRLLDVVLILLLTTLIVSVWKDTGAAADDVSMHIFLVGFAAGTVMILIGFPRKKPGFSYIQRESRPLPSLIACHVMMGGVIGLAVGTTDWGAVQLAGWWQLWWTVPLLMVYVSQLIVMRKRSSEDKV